MSVRRVFFYCRDEVGNLQEDVIALAEGLRALNVPYSANTNYWQRSTSPGDFLFTHDAAITPDDCDLVVVSYTWPLWIEPSSFTTLQRPLPEQLFKPDRRYRTVYMDSHDGYRTISWEPEFRQFDVILRSKLNQRAWHPANMRPWALGLNARILEATRDAPPIAERRRSVLINFGASHPFAHATRERAARVLEPRLERVIDIDRTVDDLTREPAAAYDALMWRQTGHRFSRAYYERLKSSQAVACFCGDMIPAAPFAGADRYLAGGNRAKLRRLLYEAVDWVDRRPQRAIQWDSFRFWEALAAGCAAINIDLEKYGVALPEMPVNWTHYIGIDFDRPDDAVERIAGDPGLLERVGTAGRQWAMEHYSPRAMAARLLEWTA